MKNKETPEPQNVDDCIKAEAAKDYEGLLVQFRAMKCLLNSQGKILSWYANRDYSLSERRLNELTSSLESEREMNAELTAEVERLSHPKQEPTPIDVEAITDIAWEVFFSSNKPAPYNQMKDVILHLASAGYFRAPLPKIEGLEEAISFFGEQYTIRTMSKDEADHRGKIWKAARAYQKASEGV